MGRGRWFWALVAVGVAARAYLVVFTEGTADVWIWRSHAETVLGFGSVAEAYRIKELLNHPPLACWAVARLLALSHAWRVPFALLLRAPIAALDVGSVFLVAWVLRGSRERWLAAGLYAVHPVAIILSAYHGNSDAAIAFFLLLAVGCAAESRALRAGVALGVSTWIKLPGLLALPALALSFSRARDRVVFAAAALATGVASYLPWLVTDPVTLYERVFSYHGQVLQTSQGVLVWGPLALLAPLFDLPAVLEAARTWSDYDTLVIVPPIVAIAWLRRGERTAEGIGATVARCYGAVYGLSTRFAFQYFAWSVPLWWLAGRRFFAGATVLAGAWLYGLYAWLCGDPFLRGKWDFGGHPVWPTGLVLLRDAGVIFFLAATIREIAAGSISEWRARQSERREAP